MAYDVGLLILRLCLGVTMAAHDYNKFFSGDEFRALRGGLTASA